LSENDKCPVTGGSHVWRTDTEAQEVFCEKCGVVDEEATVFLRQEATRRTIDEAARMPSRRALRLPSGVTEIPASAAPEHQTVGARTMEIFHPAMRIPTRVIGSQNFSQGGRRVTLEREGVSTRYQSVPKSVTRRYQSGKQSFVPRTFVRRATEHTPKVEEHSTDFTAATVRCVQSIRETDPCKLILAAYKCALKHDTKALSTPLAAGLTRISPSVAEKCTLNLLGQGKLVPTGKKVLGDETYIPKKD